MDELLKVLEDCGVEFRVGCIEKNRKKTVLSALRKLKESGDDVKVNYVKTLYRYYCTINSLGCILNPNQIPLEEDKYEINYVCNYLQGVVDSSKWVIAGVIEALGDDEPLDPFCKYLMFTHMYSPEQVKEIGHEEIYRREKEYEKELGLI